MKKRIFGVAGAVALALAAGSASALSVGTIVDGGIDIPKNNGVTAIYSAPSAIGFYGANWLLVGGSAAISVTYLGSEAGYRNRFDFGSITYTTAGGTNSFNPAAASLGSIVVGPGLLNFSFTTGAPTPVTLANGSNLDNNNTAVNFFSRIVDVVNCPPGAATPCYGGKVLDLWLDDLGGGRDDNHDDMVIRLAIEGDGNFEVVPIPAALPLLLSGLAGLGFISRRRRVVAA